MPPPNPPDAGSLTLSSKLSCAAPAFTVLIAIAIRASKNPVISIPSLVAPVVPAYAGVHRPSG